MVNWNVFVIMLIHQSHLRFFSDFWLWSKEIFSYHRSWWHCLSIVRGEMGITILFFFRVMVYTNTHMYHIIWNINEDKIILPTCMTYSWQIRNAKCSKISFKISYSRILIRCEALQRGSFLLRARIKALRVLQVEANIQSMGVWYRYQRIDASLWRKLWTCTHC